MPSTLGQHRELLRHGVTRSTRSLPQRLDQVIRDQQAAGIMVANMHIYTLEDGSRRKDADQLRFKHEVDPLGLLNPGKTRSFIPGLPGALH